MKSCRVLMLSFGLVAVATLGLGCKGGEMLKAQEGFANKVCACKDIACVRKVQKEQEAWVKKHGEAAVGNEEMAKKMNAVNKKMTDCIKKIVAAKK